MTKEADVQKRFNKWVKILKKLDLKAWHSKLSDRYQSGIPDNVLVFNKQTYWAELKRPGQQATKIQDKVGRDIVKAGGIWICLSSIEGVDGFFKGLIYNATGSGWKKPNFKELLNEASNN